MLNPANIPENLRRYLPGDFQTTNQFEQKQNNHLYQNRFIFVINRCPTVSFYLQRVNMPSITLGISQQSNPTSFDIRFPGNKFTFEDLVISFPVDENMKNYLEIFNWVKSIAPWRDNVPPSNLQQTTSDATLYVLNSSYNHILTYKYYNIFPSFISGLDFDITISDTEPVFASAAFTFDYFDITENFTI